MARSPERPRGPRPGAPTAQELSALMRTRLIESRLTPNAISMTGLLGNIAAAAFVTQHWFIAAALTFVAGSVMDTLDGRYSRMSGKGTAFGAFLDSTLDRIEEGIVLTTVGAFFASQGDEVTAGAVVVAAFTSLGVSYTRARAEALGVECKVGIATRAVRVTILAIGLFFADGRLVDGVDLLEPAVYVLAVLGAVTMLQRIFHVRKALKPVDTNQGAV